MAVNFGHICCAALHCSIVLIRDLRRGPGDEAVLAKERSCMVGKSCLSPVPGVLLP